MSNESRLSFFDIMSAINEKRYSFDEDVEKAYNVFMINRGYSLLPETVLHASEMNGYPDLDKRLQYDFYYFSLPKKKRFGKWDKAAKASLDEELLMELFKISRDKCPGYIRVLDTVNPEWRSQAAARLHKGGRQ